MTAPVALFVVKLIHTAAWAVLASCVLLAPVAAHHGCFRLAASMMGAVWVEILLLALNRWSCPLTPLAARYTRDRSDNFDIFLPRWLARYNKHIFGSLFVAGALYTAVQWWHHAGPPVEHSGHP